MEANSLFIGVAMLILLAVTSMRYGVDSREEFDERRRERVPHGIVWDAPSPVRQPLKPAKVREARPAPQPAACALVPCAD